ncbi:hypothetical protein QA541_00715 [Macrococcus psychrotolerans]|uniref:Uncharacterized protein n=1 Tax=Macrococcus psychrotolerans TaxID=3039389 RepID=A0AAU6RA21_9STAP
MSKLEREINDDGLVDAFYNDTDELIIFIDEKNNILTMNQAAQKVIDLHDNIDGLTRNLCRTCLGVTSENAIMECKDCFIKREQNNQSFQLFLKDENGSLNRIQHLTSC